MTMNDYTDGTDTDSKKYRCTYYHIMHTPRISNHQPPPQLHSP